MPDQKSQNQTPSVIRLTARTHLETYPLCTDELGDAGKFSQSSAGEEDKKAKERQARAPALLQFGLVTRPKDLKSY